MYLLSVIFPVWIAITFISGTTAQIIGGRIVTSDEFKYQVLISQMGKQKCSGAVIAAYYVLTAAHCMHMIKISEILIVAGTTDKDDETKVVRAVKESHIHPNFKMARVESTEHSLEMSRMENDIAVLRLDYPLKFGGGISKIDLPTTNILYCDTCVVAGWGSTKESSQRSSTKLRWATLTILDSELCDHFGSFHGPKEFCAYDSFELQTTNHGDSGSPLRCNGKVTGIVSAGWKDPKIPALFTNVYEHLDFINKIIRG